MSLKGMSMYFYVDLRDSGVFSEGGLVDYCFTKKGICETSLEARTGASTGLQ